MRDILGSAGAVLLAIAIGVGAVAAVGTPALYGPPGAVFRASFPTAVHGVAPGALGVAPAEVGGARLRVYTAGDVSARLVGLPGYAVLAVAGSAASSPLIARAERAVSQLCADRRQVALPHGVSLRCTRTAQAAGYVVTGPAGAIEPARFPAGARGGEEVVVGHGAVYVVVAVTASQAELARFLGSFVPLGSGG